MAETSDNKNMREDELDLLDLFRRMGRTLNRWAGAFVTGFLISVVFLLKKWLPLGLSIAIGIGISFLLKTTSASFYTSDMVIRNNLAKMDLITLRDNTGTTAELIAKLNKLHNFCTDNNTSALSASMSLKPESVKNIADINAFWIIDQSRDGIPDYVDYKGNHNVYDTINIRMQDRINIRVKISTPQDLNVVKNGIIHFIENDSLYQQRNRVRIKQNADLLVRLNYDIIQLDSLQKVKYFEEPRRIKPAGNGQIVFMQDQKTQLLYGDIHQIFSQKQLLESEQELYKGIVTILSDFSSPTRRDNGALYYGRYIIPLLFFMTLLILIIIANWTRVNETFKKY